MQNKLNREDGFGHVLGAEKIENEQVKIFFVRNTNKGARLGIIARKRIFPTAVGRNRVKRIIREVFRKHAINAMQLDLVVLAKVRNFSGDQTNLSNRLQALFSKIENKCADL